MRLILERAGEGAVAPVVRTALTAHQQPCGLKSGINEALLFYGAGPQKLHTAVLKGMKRCQEEEGRFGSGVYLTESIASAHA
eukprot:5353772-Amphidinium_carterae.1